MRMEDVTNITSEVRMKNYYQPEIETMPLSELRVLQNERLIKQVKHVYDNQTGEN